MSQVAETIRDQIGHKALYMMGAKNLGADENSLSFRIRGSNKVNHIKVTLNSMDTYDITYSKIWGAKCKTVATSEGYYTDMLLADFEEKTGLYTSL